MRTTLKLFVFLSCIGLWFEVDAYEPSCVQEEKKGLPTIYHGEEKSHGLDPDRLTSTEILAKSFAYGLIKGTVEETCERFEVVLHNALVNQGVDGIARIMEFFGGIAGDLMAKKAVDVSVQLLIDAATGPIDAPNKLLKITNAITILDGLLANLILNRLQQKVDYLKEEISSRVASQVSTQFAKTLNPYVDQEQAKLAVLLGSEIAGFTTKVVIDEALDRLTTQVKQEIEQSITCFINDCEYTKAYASTIIPMLQFMTKGSGYQLHQTTGLALLARYPLAQAKAEMEVMAKRRAKECMAPLTDTGRSLGAWMGRGTGSIVGSFICHEVADQYINGLGATLSQKILASLEQLTSLKDYSQVSDQNYLRIVEKEVKEILKLKKEAEQKAKEEQFQHEWGELVLKEHVDAVKLEQKYEKAYVRFYTPESTGVLNKYVVGPASSFAWGTKKVVKRGANMMVNGAYYSLQAIRSMTSALRTYVECFHDWGMEKLYEQMSPALCLSMGGEVGQTMVKTLCTRTLIAQGFSPDEARLFLTQKQPKDRRYYTAKRIWWVGKEVWNAGIVVVNVPLILIEEAREAGRKGWVSPFYPEFED